MELGLAFITGIASAVAYSLIQGAFNYFRWQKTKRYFTTEIRNATLFVSYHFSNVLDIDVIYTDEFGEEIFLWDDDFIEEIKSIPVTERQYKQINQILKSTRDRIQTLRKEALSVPIFVAPDFHAVDDFLRDLDNFLSFYSWIDVVGEEADKRLKEKLAEILKNSKQNPFPRNFLDDLWRWYNRKYFYIKNRVNGHGQKESRDILPF